MQHDADINTSTGSISTKEKILALNIYDDVTQRALVSDLEIESVGSVGQAGFTY